MPEVLTPVSLAYFKKAKELGNEQIAKEIRINDNMLRKIERATLDTAWTVSSCRSKGSRDTASAGMARFNRAGTDTTDGEE
jgi:hypothetical protein